MVDIREYQQDARLARGALKESEETLYSRRNHLHARQDELARARRQGKTGLVQRLEKEIRDLEARIDEDLRRLSTAKAGLFQTLERLPGVDRPWELVKEMGDHLPFLLFPVRIETRFMAVDGGRELWVRIFPDDIAVHTHEKALTADEVDAGKSYWRERWAAAQESGEERQKREKGAWRALAEAYGGTRAAWIAGETRPETLAVSSADALVFPVFDPETLKAESWSRAPRANVMPDRFVIMTFSGGKQIHRQAGNLIPQPLFMGPDPQKLEEEYRQESGELRVGEDIAWIYDFDKAVATGMGVRIPLEEPHASQGFDRVLVLGLRLSSSAEENQALLETLLENHRYAPNGMSLVPQGTPTNNTGNGDSGFSSLGPSAEESFALETGGVLFDPTSEAFEKTDGQRLAEALGIGHEPLQRIRFANRRDLKEAMAMNKALWHGTLGYFLEEMLELDLTTIGRIRQFFTDYVTGRGPLPALRVGTQPYGVLLTSDFSRWKWSREFDGAQLPFLDRLYAVMRQAQGTWRSLAADVPQAGAPGDPFQNLLRMLGLHATSIEYYRRRAVGKEYTWNYEIFNAGSFSARRMMILLERQAQVLLEDLGYDFEQTPRLFDLFFFLQHDALTDPLIDDIPEGEPERFSETKPLKSIYKIPNSDDPDNPLEANYIGWLLYSDFDDLKRQRFENLTGEQQPIPRPLLYRMLRGALLQAYHDASMQLYTHFEVLAPATRREVALSNMQSDRTVTRWEFMEADVSQVVPQLSPVNQSMGRFLQTEAGLNRPEALSLGEVRASLEALSHADVSTARLERLFAEYLDLCAYRLDAWQMGCFHRRLQQQRYPADSEGLLENRVQGIYLGAFGWLEDLRPAPEPVPTDLSSIPPSLHDPEQEGPLFEQPGSGGFIHGPSLNHAVAAAVLRNTYLTHFDTAHPEKMAVNLSSARVRTALSFLEGTRNGQELGALLGYQFERGLHDRYGDPSLNQFIPLIRQRYPLVADKITADEEGEQIETKEARNVLDGYALVEAAFLKEPSEPYPYGVAGLPADPESGQARAIQAEVARLADSFDAIADLALAEGVYQVVQGNFERAGAMLKAFTEGNHPPEPEIVRTPRSGAALTQRIALHFETGAAVESRWGETPSARTRIEPGLNRWLGSLLPAPDKIQYIVRLGEAAVDVQNLSSLDLQPIDLVYLIGDELADETTELESRIAYVNRRHKEEDALEVRIEFMVSLADPEGITLFELLPLLRNLRILVTGCRPLAADDFVLPSETTTDPTEDLNPKDYDLTELRTRTGIAIDAFDSAVGGLAGAIPPFNAAGEPDLALANAETLRSALETLAGFGVPDAFPRSAFGETDAAKGLLINQAVLVKEVGQRKLASATALKAEADEDDSTLSGEERAVKYRAAAGEIFGPSFNLIPLFSFKNAAEIAAAANFRSAAPALNLTRFHQDNPHLVDEWLQGVACVREKVGALEAVDILGEAFEGMPMTLQPLQLPFRETDHWVAVAYPEVAPEDLDKPDTFVPEGDFLSLVQWLPESGFEAGEPQSGLLIDEWVEVIPGKQATTGIAVHYNQPSSEPPQVLLLAVTPEITGAWSWDKLTGTLHDTFDRARQRAVEPDQLGDTAYAQLLPTILSAVPSYPLATISTDFIHRTATE